MDLWLLDFLKSYLELFEGTGVPGLVLMALSIGAVVGGACWLTAFLLFELIERPRYYFARKHFWENVRAGKPPELPPRRRHFNGSFTEKPGDMTQCAAVQRQVRALKAIDWEKLGLERPKSFLERID